MLRVLRRRRRRAQRQTTQHRPGWQHRQPSPTLIHRIVDDEGRDVQLPRRSGELLFTLQRRRAFLVEYFGNPEASANKCADGWLHMGDIVHQDDDGWLYFDFRKGGGIRRNGDFIDPHSSKRRSPNTDGRRRLCLRRLVAIGAPGEKDVVAAVVSDDRIV